MQMENPKSPEKGKMQFTVFMGSPNLISNTAALCRPFIETLKARGASVRYVTIADKNIAPCRGCYACRESSDGYGCILRDDMPQIAADILWADCIVLATPIYIGNCPAKLKAMIDRAGSIGKRYGAGRGSPRQSKRVALMTTNGYDGDYMPEVFAKRLENLCRHGGIRYAGIYSVRDLDDFTASCSDTAADGARAFAARLLRHGSRIL